MAAYTQIGQLSIDSGLYDFIETDALPGTQVDSGEFWQGFESLLQELMPLNKALLDKRDNLQTQIDNYHREHPTLDAAHYKAFLQDIGYLQPQPGDFQIETTDVDDEIARLAGPQLVVPINNARYALNAANARWGSLYDAAYGTDVLAESDGAERGKGYNPVRGQKVIEFARQWLDNIAPLERGSHVGSTAYEIVGNDLLVTLADGSCSALKDSGAFAGYLGSKGKPEAILLSHHGLHAEIQFDASHPVGKTDPAAIKDILLESALTTIMDCEDSVAAVDGEDKTLVYRNWLGLMRGTLTAELSKGGKTIVRDMADDRQYKAPQSGELTLSGRSLMLVRNVGHLMTNPAIRYKGKDVPEGIMDAVVTSLIAKHDLLGLGRFKNSRSGSVYIVKPKMHGPEEVAFTDRLFNGVESLLGLAPNTLKMGIMDEERRTSLNLRACIQAARQRVIFINTGFLDRTGDEIHTSMLAGAFAPKAELKTMTWIQAYERANVAAGLSAGLSGKAQIGKGMWPIPDQMAEMMKQKIGHPKAGANTAWVPSPTAATLHALHYHQVDVFAIQRELAKESFDGRDQILQVPLMEKGRTLTADEIGRELDNNCQGILGYVVRWVHQGVGCSKVPDINNVGLMEDRATLRISSQHIANWLKHGIVSIKQVEASLLKMAALVDKQNADDPEYIPMGPNYSDTIAFQAASELIFEGHSQPSGYTEPVLHKKRLEMKALKK
ncbi:malate synthase G [Aliiglaciecola sp. CAU 1673]|uniref:malate synthase G n=1 Tax=Aliiglaciecola sp. CAU 1673 TaxID=3032595 RepID=UPI0023DBD99B|nr:malate synthase G [Aliiglaciecola sp. CAU 1673]MDF2176981.1 malate synthase G [Aliiglaciecola sp. CAU 1673]